jgi:hypothetical protein
VFDALRPLPACRFQFIPSFIAVIFHGKL